MCAGLARDKPAPYRPGRLNLTIFRMTARAARGAHGHRLSRRCSRSTSCSVPVAACRLSSSLPMRKSSTLSCGVAKACGARRMILSSPALPDNVWPFALTNSILAVCHLIAGQASLRSSSARATAKSRAVSVELATGRGWPAALPSIKSL